MFQDDENEDYVKDDHDDNDDDDDNTLDKYGAT